MLCGSRGSLVSVLWEASCPWREKLISTVLVGSAVGETFGSSAVRVWKRAPVRESPGPVRWGLRAFSRSHGPAIPAVVGDREIDPKVPGMLRILPPRLCVKFGDGTAGAAFGPVPAPSPGVLRPPLGTPLPENSWTVEKAAGAALTLCRTCCDWRPTVTNTGCPELGRLSGTAMILLGWPRTSTYWRASAPRTEASGCLSAFGWASPAVASTEPPDLVWIAPLSSAGAWCWLKPFLVVSKTWGRALLCAGRRYRVPVLSKLYTWPLFSHWSRCLHGPTRVRRWCWLTTKHSREPSRNTTMKELPIAQWCDASGSELRHWQRNQQPLRGTSWATGWRLKRAFDFRLRHAQHAHSIQTCLRTNKCGFHWPARLGLGLVGVEAEKRTKTTQIRSEYLMIRWLNGNITWTPLKIACTNI